VIDKMIKNITTEYHRRYFSILWACST